LKILIDVVDFKEVSVTGVENNSKKCLLIGDKDIFSIIKFDIISFIITDILQKVQLIPMICLVVTIKR
jgi:hypothetical protein